MSVGLYSHTTRATGTVLTASIYNSDHQNHITNQNPSATGGYSDSVGQMQTVTDPGGVGTESLAPHLAGELERIRFCIKRITNKSHWYVAPSFNLDSIGNPTDFAFSETLKATGDLTPAQINANQNDYAPTGHADAFTFRLSSDAIRTITGLAGGAAGRIIEIANVGANAIQLTHEDAGSAAGNRFVLNSGQAPLTLSAGEAMMFKYDGTLLRWRPMNTADMASPSFTNLAVTGNNTFGGYTDYTEIAAPANPAANNLRVFAKDISGVTVPAALDSAGSDPTIPARSYAEYTTNENLNTAIPMDNTIPQNTEGQQPSGLSVSITPKRPNSRVRVICELFGACLSAQADDSEDWTMALFKDSGANALKAVRVGAGVNNAVNGTITNSNGTLVYEEAPGAGTFTYSIRVGPKDSPGGATLRLNGTTSGQLYGGVAKSSLVAEEIFV